ncbi:IS3 family transposase [Bacillus timonensis]|uniref:IS3 family transposase n=1 Tax=Bacillus timonensis TaxID=1033734 RepID=UPI00028A280D
MSKRAFSAEYKYEVLKAWEDGLFTLSELAKKFKVNISTIQDWRKKAIDEYIYFYNHNRYQKRLNGLCPLEFGAQAA